MNISDITDLLLGNLGLLVALLIFIFGLYRGWWTMGDVTRKADQRTAEAEAEAAAYAKKLEGISIENTDLKVALARQEGELVAARKDIARLEEKTDLQTTVMRDVQEKVSEEG